MVSPPVNGLSFITFGAAQCFISKINKFTQCIARYTYHKSHSEFKGLPSAVQPGCIQGRVLLGVRYSYKQYYQLVVSGFRGTPGIPARMRSLTSLRQQKQPPPKQDE